MADAEGAADPVAPPRTIRTVLGDVAPSVLGAADYHEHLFQVSPALPGDELDDEEASGAEARLLRGSGFAAMIDATPIGLGRRPGAVARISRACGLHVVQATGVHRDEHYPGDHWLRRLDADARAELFVRDVETGVPERDVPRADDAPAAVGPDDGPVRAGLIKAGIGYWRISPFEAATLEAVALAQVRTRRPVMVHLEHGSAAHEVLDRLDGYGVAPSRVVLAHADRNPDAGLHLELVSRGAWLGYDGAARSRVRTDAELLDLTARVVAGGGGGRILLGGDVARRSRYEAYGGMPGMAYLGRRYVPRLRERLGAAALGAILVTNPATFLAAASE